MELVESIFNIPLNGNDGSFALYNTFSGALARFDRPLDDELTAEYQDTLLSQGFLVPKDLDEVNRVLTMRSEEIESHDCKTQVFEIAPTLKCQASCGYCFQKLLPGNPTMDPNMVDIVAAFICKSIEAIKPENVEIVWFGGEPTLSLNKILRLGECVNEYCQLNGIGFKSRMVSNGILLDSSTVRSLKHSCCLHEVQISIDGTDYIYACAKGIDAYRQVVSNIEAICDDIDVVIRVNVSRDNLDSVDELVVDLLENHRLDGRVTLYFAKIEEEDGCEMPEDTALAVDEFDSVRLEMYRKYLPKYNSVKVKQLLPRIRRSYCPLERKVNAMIAPDGFMYDCEDTLGYKEKSFSHVSKGLGALFDARPLAHEIPDECIKPTCPLLPTCLGGCPEKNRRGISCRGRDKELESTRKTLNLVASNLS